MLDKFFSNIKKVRDADCSFTVEVTPSDELIPHTDELIELCIAKVGAKPHITIARDERDPNKLPILTNMTTEEYYKYWGTKFESDLFNFKTTIYEKKINEFCYAGDWSAYLNLGTGIMTQCYHSNYSQNIFKDINKPIKFKAIGQCKEHHCYNGHAWIALGDIPQYKTLTYAEERNRICNDGTEWLQPEMKSFMSTKLYESNQEYSELKKKLCLIENKTNIYKSKLRNLKKRISK